MDLRPATPRDIPALTTLLGILFEQEADFTPDPAVQTAGLRMLLDSPALGSILVGIDDTGRAMGMVSLLYSVSTAEGGRVATLEDMIIHPDSRGHGLGSRLLAAAIDLARASGCRRITLLTDAANSGAIAFYNRAGFQRSSMIPLRLPLG